MKVTSEKQPKSELKLTIELSDDQMKKYKDLAVKELQDKVKVEGFRSGHIPMELLIQKVGEQSFMGVVLDIAISDAYEEAIKKEKIHPVAYPKVNVLTHDPLKFEATVPVLPEVELKSGVDKLMVSPKKQTVKDDEIQSVLDNLKTRQQKWVDVDRAAKMEDRVEIDFDGFDEAGVPLDGTSSKNHPVILGSNSLIPGFEEEVVGMKKEDEKDFTITFPKDYHAPHFQSKKVKFHIKLNRIETPEEVKLDDAFAEELTQGRHTTLKALKDEIKEELMQQKERDENMRLENEFLEEFAKLVKADVPEALVEREKEFLKGRIEKDLEGRGLTWEQYEEMMKEKKKDLGKEIAEQAERQILIRLGLEKLYEHDKIEVTEKDVDAEVGRLLESYPPAYAEAVRENYKPGSDGREQLQQSLMIQKLVAKHTKK